MFFRLVVSHVSFLSCLAWCLPWCLVFTTVCDLATAQENSERSVTLDKDAIRELTQQFCERRKVPGLSLAIAQDGELRLAEGFGFGRWGPQSSYRSEPNPATWEVHLRV